MTAEIDIRPHPPLLDSKHHALFLDPDGALIKFNAQPLAVESDVIARALLRQLTLELNGALAVISGRSIAEIDHIFKSTVSSVSGLHGQELRYGAQTLRQQNGTAPHGAARMLRQFTAEDKRLFIEVKGAGLALHYRQAPELEASSRRAVSAAAKAHGLKVLHGDAVSELIPPEASRASALLTFMAQDEFCARSPVIIGAGYDDELFALAHTLGGFSVSIGAQQHACADYRLRDTYAARSWLFKSIGIGEH